MEFTLRKWRESDIDAVAKYADNPKIAERLRDVFPNPYTYEDAKVFVEMILAADESRDLFRAIDVNGEAVGSIGVFVQGDVYRKSGELGYWLAEPYWRKGIMSAAVKQICAEAFQKYDIVKIFAEPYADNAGSCGVLEKAGFTLEGVMKYGVFKNGELHDYRYYSLFNDDRQREYNKI